ncbi:hypothetical protein [Caproiciproducens faecalis]|uniref:Uncharacterized protein n=1 Tax=Caproiciproducens faecalis TaxID=2820301 RepID=A0ABS7DRR7_9FIRM|nr:hypothetical protein [Caproiciproducens faecalis]MBW7573993.1 hypothetical protein [Caproiciproducens faecalis]
MELKDKERIARILQTIPDAENNAQILIMSEGDNELGYVAVDMQSSVIRMLKMEIFGCENLAILDDYGRLCADSMLRAAASYGATIGAYRIESRIEALQEFFSGCGFIQSTHKFISPLSNFIKICQN